MDLKPEYDSRKKTEVVLMEDSSPRGAESMRSTGNTRRQTRDLTAKRRVSCAIFTLERTVLQMLKY